MFTNSQYLHLNFKWKMIVFLLVFLTGNLLLGFALTKYVDLKTNKNFFIDEKYSKIKHMGLQGLENVDTIVIGGSTVLFHVSNQVFKERNLKIYNLGSNGAFMSAYCSLVKAALKHEPKVIILSIPIKALFFEPAVSVVGGKVLMSLDDLKALIKTQDGFFKTLGYLVNYFKSFSPLSAYGETINLKIRSQYQRFNPKKKSMSVKMMVRQNQLKGEKNENMFLTDCRLFDLKVHGERVIGKCTNGDGVLFRNVGSGPVIAHKESVTLMPLNDNYINLLNFILDKVAETEKTT